MNTQHMRYVVEVEKTGSITKAAHNLYMGQPNLSKAIKELESELGIIIFKRTAKGVEPTHQGAEFLSYAKTILAQIDELESLYKPHTQKSVTLNVSAPRATYISVAFANFLSQYTSEEQLNVRYHETSAPGAIHDVAGGESNLAIIRSQEMYEPYYQSLLREHGLVSEELWSFSMSVLMSESHSLAGYEDIPYHLLSGCTEIVHGDFQPPPLSFAHIRKSARLETPHKSIAVYDRGIQFDLLQRVHDTFMWVSPMPQDELERKHLVLRRCSSAAAVNRDLLVTNPKRPLNRHEALFVEALRQSLKQTDLVCPA